MILVSQAVVDVSLRLEITSPLGLIFDWKIYFQAEFARLSLKLKVKRKFIVDVNLPILQFIRNLAWIDRAHLHFPKTPRVLLFIRKLIRLRNEELKIMR